MVYETKTIRIRVRIRIMLRILGRNICRRALQADILILTYTIIPDQFI